MDDRAFYRERAEAAVDAILERYRPFRAIEEAADRSAALRCLRDGLGDGRRAPAIRPLRSGEPRETADTLAEQVASRAIQSRPLQFGHSAIALAVALQPSADAALRLLERFDDVFVVKARPAVAALVAVRIRPKAPFRYLPFVRSLVRAVRECDDRGTDFADACVAVAACGSAVDELQVAPWWEARPALRGEALRILVKEGFIEAICRACRGSDGQGAHDAVAFLAAAAFALPDARALVTGAEIDAWYDRLSKGGVADAAERWIARRGASLDAVRVATAMRRSRNDLRAGAVTGDARSCREGAAFYLLSGWIEHAFASGLAPVGWRIAGALDSALFEDATRQEAALAVTAAVESHRRADRDEGAPEHLADPRVRLLATAAHGEMLRGLLDRYAASRPDAPWFRHAHAVLAENAGAGPIVGALGCATYDAAVVHVAALVRSAGAARPALLDATSAAHLLIASGSGGREGRAAIRGGLADALVDAATRHGPMPPAIRALATLGARLGSRARPVRPIDPIRSFAPLVASASPEEDADAVSDLVAACGWDAPWILGPSFGGAVAAAGTVPYVATLAEILARAERRARESARARSDWRGVRFRDAVRDAVARTVRVLGGLTPGCTDRDAERAAAVGVAVIAAGAADGAVRIPGAERALRDLEGGSWRTLARSAALREAGPDGIGTLAWLLLVVHPNRGADPERASELEGPVHEVPATLPSAIRGLRRLAELRSPEQPLGYLPYLFALARTIEAEADAPAELLGEVARGFEASRRAEEPLSAAEAAVARADLLRPSGRRLAGALAAVLAGRILPRPPPPPPPVEELRPEPFSIDPAVRAAAIERCRIARLAAARSEIAELRRLAAAARRETDAARRELEAARGGAAELLDEIAALRSERDAARAEAIAATAELELIRPEAEAYHAERTARAWAETESAELRRVRNELQERIADLRRGKCTICMDAPKRAAMVPCGHAMFCDSCAARVLSLDPVCPYCREHVERRLDLFF